MGVGKIHLELFMGEARTQRFSGKILTLGRQDVRFDRETLDHSAALHGVELSAVDSDEPADKPEYASQAFLSDRTFFRALGFSELHQLDASPYEGADTIVDLNIRGVPAELRDRFDVIYNGGTLEHVFHLPNALENLHHLLTVDGRIIHAGPASNAIDHGFYSCSPTLFLDFYSANGYAVETLSVVRVEGRPGLATSWTVLDYDREEFGRIGLGGLDDAYYTVFCVVSRQPESTGDAIPQQGVYDGLWQR